MRMRVGDQVAAEGSGSRIVLQEPCFSQAFAARFDKANQLLPRRIENVMNANVSGHAAWVGALGLDQFYVDREAKTVLLG